ncbi:MAG: HD domain-containing phosphohydrolase [Pseudomonadota bacterium]
MLLLERGATVDAEEARAAAREILDAAAAESARRPHTTSIFDLWGALAPRLRRLARSVHIGSEFLPGIKALARDLTALAEKEPDIGIFLALRQERNNHIDYGYNHAVHTGMACVLMARRLEWPTADGELLARAALTMNLSIADLQGRMASQDFAPLERQRVFICRHPKDSVDLLVKAGVTDIEWLRAVGDHHEHVGGGGYPSGTKSVGRFAQALRLADVFTAKLTPRLLRTPLSPQEAERQMYAEGRADAGTMEMVMALIKEFGIYPPGDAVLLASGEVAVVVRRSAGAKTPLVATITDTRGRPITATHRRDTADSSYAIVGPAADKSLVARMPPERVYGFALAK